MKKGTLNGIGLVSFWGAILLGGLAVSHHHEVVKAGIDAEDAHRITAVEREKNNPRLTAIMNATAHGGLEGGYEPDDATVLRILFDQKYRVALANGLPNGAMVKIDKHDITIESGLAQDTQEDVLRLTAAYIDGQNRDHLPYGNGELRTLGNGKLVAISKMARGYEKILVPTPPG